MRLGPVAPAALLFSFSAFFAACGSDDGATPSAPGTDGGATDGGAQGSNDGGSDGAGGNDGGGNDGASDAGDGGLPRFVIETPEIDVLSGEDVIKCFYLHVPSSTDIAVKEWKSTQSAGIAHAALVLADTDRKPVGTVSADDCVIADGAPSNASWVYSAFELQDGWAFPADDGTGKPLAKTVKANQPAYVLMHLTNAGASAAKLKVTIEGIGHAPGVATTAAEPYVTYNDDISIGPATVGDEESKTCATPAGAKLARVSTLSRKLSTKTEVITGGTAIFTGTDWEDPGALAPTQAPFPTFTNDQVTVKCTYSNPGAGTVTSGSSVGDESCTMLAYHFPATKPRLCFNSTLLP